MVWCGTGLQLCSQDGSCSLPAIANAPSRNRTYISSSASLCSIRWTIGALAMAGSYPVACPSLILTINNGNSLSQAEGDFAPKYNYLLTIFHRGISEGSYGDRLLKNRYYSLSMREVWSETGSSVRSKSSSKYFNKISLISTGFWSSRGIGRRGLNILLGSKYKVLISGGS